MTLDDAFVVTSFKVVTRRRRRKEFYVWLDENCGRFTEAWSGGNGGEEARAARGFGWPHHSRRREHHHG